MSTVVQSTARAVRRANAWLLACVAAFCFVTGAVLWETVLFVPAWSRSPPSTLALTMPPSGIDPSLFWGIVHGSFELLLVATVIANWNVQGRRKPTLLLVAVYAIPRIWTLAYFAPTYLHFQALARSGAIEPSVVNEASRWKELSYGRTIVGVATNLALIFAYHRATNGQHIAAGGAPAIGEGQPPGAAAA